MKIKTKATPRPWEVDGSIIIGNTDHGREIIGKFWRFPDAILAGAAPDLLAAAKSLIKEYPCAASPAWLALRDAMAKAEGVE